MATMTKAMHKELEAEWEIGTTRLFGNFDLGTAGLISGWSAPEDPHIWNDGPEAVMQIVTGPVRRTLRVTVEAIPFISGNVTSQDVTLYVNGSRIGFWRLQESKSYLLSGMIEPEQIFERDGKALLTCSFHLPKSAKPVDVGAGKDSRELGLCFRSITLA
ncbi:MAG TPA: hypothetical protein VL752_00015 [Acidisoma sp.]|uniref:hypothetical protein n=1 Tax=Acidisoma sp. TaxID=1872115 RepID=UPI002B9463D7|nr:hypothetical protein [Acidisoma sp.]HTH99301.1 hypothetical protein [Acidisoma sp.]